MFKFSKKEYGEEAICPSCGEWKPTDFTPEQLKDMDWECMNCENKRVNAPQDHPENRGSKPISKYDPEFDFLTRLIKLIAKEGVPPDEIKAIVDANRPLETIDQAGNIAAQIWTLATEKYQIPREWLIKMLPDTKTKKACLQISADQYNQTDPEWPTQNAAEDFSDRPAGSVAYAPEKQSKPANPKKKYVAPPLGIGPQKPGNEDAGHGFYDSPGPADLGKDPKGDFPTNTWMPMGTEDMDAEYWDNVAALSKKELHKFAKAEKSVPRSKATHQVKLFDGRGVQYFANEKDANEYYEIALKEKKDPSKVQTISPKEASLVKKANPDSRYWIAPDGTEFPVSGIHPVWLLDNGKILKKYGINPKQATYEIHEQMMGSGWSRVSTERPGFQIEIADLNHIPPYLDDFVAKHFQQGDELLIGNGKEPGVFLRDPFPTLQKAVNKQRMQDRSASLKKADFSGQAINEILRLLQTNGGVTYNLQKGDLAGSDMFAVSIYPDREQIQQLGNFEDIENFIESNLDLLNDPNNSFGAWSNEGKVYYDVVATVPDEKQALELGRTHNQLAIFDLKNGMEIKTGVERFSFSKKHRLVEASLVKWALARQDVVDFYLLSLLPMDYLVKESKDPNSKWDGLAIFRAIVQQLRDEYITRGMEELRDEAETTRWITKIPDHKMPEELKPYYTFHETGYYPSGSSQRHQNEDKEPRYPYTCEDCGNGLSEDDVFTYADHMYCENCESNQVTNDIHEYVKFCTDDNKFVCPSEYADDLEGYMPDSNLDNEEEHGNHNLVPYSEGSKMWKEVMENAQKQMKLRFPREPKPEQPIQHSEEAHNMDDVCSVCGHSWGEHKGTKCPVEGGGNFTPFPPTSAAFPEASLKTAGEGAYGTGGPYWQAPSNFDNMTAQDFYNIFEYAPWAPSYGGPAWAEIAKTIGKMQITTDLQSLVVLIDHYHDLGHNTGKLLDKFPEWQQWFKALLDMKAQPGSLRKLLSGSSRPVRDLVLEYYKVQGRPEALESALYKRLSKKAEESPLTQEQQDQIAASSSPVYNIALNNFFEAFKRGHGKDRSFAYAVDSVKNLEKIDPKKLVEFANTYLQGLI